MKRICLALFRRVYYKTDLVAKTEGDKILSSSYRLHIEEGRNVAHLSMSFRDHAPSRTLCQCQFLNVVKCNK